MTTLYIVLPQQPSRLDETLACDITFTLHVYDWQVTSGGGNGGGSSWWGCCQVRHLQVRNHWIFLTGDRGVSTFVSVMPLDSFEETSEQFPLSFLHTNLVISVPKHYDKT